MEKAKESIRKHERVLEIYSRLLNGETIYKQELANEYGVTPRSIQRDIDSIRDFCSNRTSQGNDIVEIKYDYAVKGFRIVNSKTITLTSAELFTVIKIILESRSLNKDETKTIISNLINVSIPASEKKKMSDLILNELFHYVAPRHGKKLVNTIWELSSAIYSHHIIHLDYRKANGNFTQASIKPVGIMNSEFYFYLVAYIGDRDKKYPGYPTIYRIDRIDSYHITTDSFRIPYKNRFEEGEFRKRIPFMFTGKLQKSYFIYSGSDLDAILDRFPTATASLQSDGSYLICVELFGNIGLNLWLKGQGNSVKLLREE